MRELYNNIGYHNLNYEYVGSAKDVSFLNTWILKNFLMQ